MGIALIGAGGHAKIVFDAIVSAKEYEVIGFVDDNPQLAGTFFFNLPVVNQIELLDSVEGYIVAIGDNVVRKAKYELYKNKGYLPVNAIHRSAIISPYASIGNGVVAFANVVVNPGTCINDNVILYTACTIDHDCQISEHAYISPGCNLSGRVTIGTGAFLGTGAVVLPQISIGEWSIIGAGAVVTKDIPAHVTAVGVPAKIIKQAV
jgi:sugar O-acyltransferase (sialic acid O-acetyltransferase NeuD family)